MQVVDRKVADKIGFTTTRRRVTTLKREFDDKIESSRENRINQDKKQHQKDIPYNLAADDRWITILLLSLMLIKVKKVRLRLKNKVKSKGRNNKNKSNKLETKKGKKITKVKKSKEYVDVNSIKYKVLNCDRAKLRRISKSELSTHILPSSAHINKILINEKPEGIWMNIHGLVFDISSLLESHPGGAECLLDCVGVDATRVFDDVGHSDIAWEMLENSCVGIMEDLESSDENASENEFNEQNYASEVLDRENGNFLDEDNDNEANIQGNKQIIYKDKYVWNFKAMEYLAIIFSASFGLLCFVYLQQKKWEDWGLQVKF